MSSGWDLPGSLLRPVQRRLARVDLREHEDKILLLLALVISAVVGLIVVAFVALTERMGRILLTARRLQRVLSPLLGSLVGGWLLFKFFPDARGSGIPQTRVALVLQNGVIRLRTVIGKFICSSISLGSGVALGREGPSVHIGAGIASVAGRRLGLSEEQVRSLIPVGTAAAVAAAFNTPLAAVLFTLEEILADLHARVVGSVVIGACTSWIVLRLILGDEPLFHVPAYQLVHSAGVPDLCPSRSARRSGVDRLCETAALAARSVSQGAARDGSRSRRPWAVLWWDCWLSLRPEYWELATTW